MYSRRTEEIYTSIQRQVAPRLFEIIIYNYGYSYVYRLFNKLNKFLIRVFNGHFVHWFSNAKAFLCGIWNLHREKLYSLGSSDLVLYSSTDQMMYC